MIQQVAELLRPAVLGCLIEMVAWSHARHLQVEEYRIILHDILMFKGVPFFLFLALAYDNFNVLPRFGIPSSLSFVAMFALA